MGRAKKTRKYAVMKKIQNPKNLATEANKKKEERRREEDERRSRPVEIPQMPSSMFFRYNTALGPPYHVLIDTNFLNFAIKNKLEIIPSMMDCLSAKATPYITDCVMAELEKLGSKYRIALRLAKDPRFERLHCTHQGTYADDCLVHRVMQHKCYIVATCDQDLKKRIRKVPGVPIMFIQGHKFAIEKLAEAN